jgi:tetratricopeptide (TPR) repeat protein
LLAPHDRNSAVNEALPQIRTELSVRRDAGTLDGYGHYLLGLVYAAQGLRIEATECYAAAIRLVPTFWGAWYEQAAFFASSTEAEAAVRSFTRTCQHFRDLVILFKRAPASLPHLVFKCALAPLQHGFCRVLPPHHSSSAQVLASPLLTLHRIV